MEEGKKELKLGVLASGRGSNFLAILQATQKGFLQARIKVVISNRSQAPVLEQARRASIPAAHISGKTHPEAEEEALLSLLQEKGVEYVVLAGYVKSLGAKILQAYPGRILNIHPSLLPAFGGKGMYGLSVHGAVLGSGEKKTGATVHVVSLEYDAGPVVARAPVWLKAGDTPEVLQKRVQEMEYLLYPWVLQRVALKELLLGEKGPAWHLPEGFALPEGWEIGNS